MCRINRGERSHTRFVSSHLLVCYKIHRTTIKIGPPTIQTLARLKSHNFFGANTTTHGFSGDEKRASKLPILVTPHGRGSESTHFPLLVFVSWKWKSSCSEFCTTIHPPSSHSHLSGTTTLTTNTRSMIFHFPSTDRRISQIHTHTHTIKGRIIIIVLLS